MVKTEEVSSVERKVWEALAEVRDPEIPPISITELGIVERVSVIEGAVEVDLLPTFAGCPALDVILADAQAAVASVTELDARVRFVYSPPWTSDRITQEGREALESHGLTPPGDARSRTLIPLGSLVRTDHITCPFCGSQQTVLESAFGPTLCRSTHFCNSCRNPFEAFKPKLP
jgi:ring-1,2-phenylacetyl-CoA epoxidase subunit PaaD